MNNYILLCTSICVLILGIFFYKLFGSNINSPTVISCFVFGIGSFIAYFGNQKWNMLITWTIFDVLLLAMFSMSFGEYLARMIYQIRTSGMVYRHTIDKIIYIIPKNIILIFVLIGIIADILYYVRMCQIAHVGYSDFWGMLSRINLARHQSEERTGTLIACLNVLHSCVWGYFTLAYINNIIVEGKIAVKKYIRYISLLPSYIFSIVIGGSRIFFISVISFVIFSYLLLNRRYNDLNIKHKTFKTLMKILAIAIVGLYILFSFMGKQSGKINDRTNAFDSFMIYAGSSITDLNLYLEAGIVRTNTPGRLTFSGLFNTVGRFISIPQGNNVKMGYILLGNGILTNIYTAFAMYLSDFGWIGFVLIQSILGIIYTITFLYIETTQKLSNAMMVYLVFFLYGLIGQLFSAETTAGLLTVNDIFGMMVYFILYCTFDKWFSYRIYSEETGNNKLVFKDDKLL